MSERIVKRARSLVGTRFRPQGRGQSGVDCIGLVAFSLGRAGVRGDYAMRGGSRAALEAGLAQAGLEAVEVAGPGDVIVVMAGPGQLHLGVWTGAGLIHADAGLRRVVERPGPVPWPIIGIWREG